jgi:hypothetical protein
MSISSGGKVGIGITVPIFKLDVRAGSINTDSLYRINGISVISRDNSNRIQLGDATSKVGIGTSTPTTALQVAGTATATEFVGGGAGIINLNAGSISTGTVSDSRLTSNVALLNGVNSFTNNVTAPAFVGSGASLTDISLSQLSGNLSIAKGGTGASTSNAARTNIGAAASGNNSDITGLFGLLNPISIAQGGTGSSTKNFVDLTTTQSIGGEKQFSNSISFTQDIFVSGITVGRGSGGSTSNTALGSYTLLDNISGSGNTAIGYNSLSNNVGGYSNTAVGSQSLASNIGGISNNAIGVSSLWSNNNGSYNIAIGEFGLSSDTTSSFNIAVGYLAGGFNVNGSGNTFIGTSTGSTFQGLSNTTCLGNQAGVDASNKIRIGNNSITSISGAVGWTTFSDGRYKRNVEENVPGLDFISKLRPVTYTTDISGLDNHYPKPTPREGQVLPELGDVSAQEKIRYSGFIAQEVEAAAKEVGYDFSGVDKPQKEGNLYGIRYAEFVVPMVKAIQEQQKQIEELKAALANKNNSGAIKLGVNDSNEEILLGQNIPNPADKSTIIPFSIPTNCKSASILITDHATSRAIKAVPLSCKDTHLMLDAGSLASGTYSYTLFVDGASVDTKQMVIVK